MRTIFFCFVFMLCGSVLSHGQSQASWQEYSTINGVKFLVQDGTCKWDAESPTLGYKFIKVENPTANRAKISFQLHIYYGNTCNGCDGSPEYRSEFILEPGGQAVGACDSDFPARLDVLVSNPNLPALQFTNFSISNITVDWVE